MNSCNLPDYLEAKVWKSLILLYTIEDDWRWNKKMSIKKFFSLYMVVTPKQNKKIIKKWMIWIHMGAGMSINLQLCCGWSCQKMYLFSQLFQFIINRKNHLKIYFFKFYSQKILLKNIETNVSTNQTWKKFQVLSICCPYIVDIFSTHCPDIFQIVLIYSASKKNAPL